MDNQSPLTPENPQGHSQAASSAGQEQSTVPEQFQIGAFNILGVDPSKVIAMHNKEQAQGTDATQTQTTTQVSQDGKEASQVAARQLTEKDERHFAQYVTKASQEKYDLARLAVEANEEAIYKIAETDKDLAQRLLKEYDFGTDNVQDLLAKKDFSKSKNPQEAEKQYEDAQWKQQMEKDLLEEKILRLKGENSDLNGDVEDKFREIYADKAFAKYDEKQKLDVARSLTGRQSTQSNADNVALAVLKREEGIASSPKGATPPENTKQVSSEMKKMMQAANLSEKDLNVLPSNIDELISSMYGPLVGQ